MSDPLYAAALALLYDLDAADFDDGIDVDQLLHWQEVIAEGIGDLGTDQRRLLVATARAMSADASAAGDADRAAAYDRIADVEDAST
jgi:hypothetical protein